MIARLLRWGIGSTAHEHVWATGPLSRETSVPRRWATHVGDLADATRRTEGLVHGLSRPRASAMVVVTSLIRQRLVYVRPSRERTLMAGAERLPAQGYSCDLRKGLAGTRSAGRRVPTAWAGQDRRPVESRVREAQVESSCERGGIAAQCGRGKLVVRDGTPEEIRRTGCPWCYS